MPRKSKKKSPKSTTKSSSGGGGIASKRHWIYASSSGGGGSRRGSGGEDEYSQYLHKRVQRTLVRSVPSTYSYFGNADDGKSGEFLLCDFFIERYYVLCACEEGGLLLYKMQSFVHDV
jgi:hypothetical protein